ncbi:hypothetical protein TNCV_941731 [Trichonephila clavipes]|nr:hypothetical protein TNCV_941731 [Trichonephila clavipes]
MLVFSAARSRMPLRSSTVFRITVRSLSTPYSAISPWMEVSKLLSSESCKCNLYRDYIDDYHRHVVTGDLGIVKDDLLRNCMEKADFIGDLEPPDNQQPEHCCRIKDSGIYRNHGRDADFFGGVTT